MNKYLTATEARENTKNAHSLDGEYMRKETDEILNNITLLSMKGHYSIQTNKTDRIIIKRLEYLGYKVVHTNDQRDGNYLTVSW